jgi:hypothetical protein
MWKILFYGFLIYLLYQVVFNFIVPVYKTTKKVKKGFREMHEKMNEQVKQEQNSAQASSNNTPKKSVGDYIDFEEIK